MAKRRINRTTTQSGRSSGRPRTATNKAAGTRTANGRTGSTTTSGVKTIRPDDVAPLKNGHGRKLMVATEPVRQVELDAGVFDFLWRYLESLDGRRYGPMVPEYEEMIQRGLAAFRAAAQSSEATAVPKRVVRRKLR
jgi:hypothetical protein